MEIKKNKLEDFFELDKISGETIPHKEGDILYNIRAIDDYCKKYNRKPESLTEKELKQFIIGIYRKDAK